MSLDDILRLETGRTQASQKWAGTPLPASESGNLLLSSLAPGESQSIRDLGQIVSRAAGQELPAAPGYALAFINAGLAVEIERGLGEREIGIRAIGAEGMYAPGFLRGKSGHGSSALCVTDLRAVFLRDEVAAAPRSSMPAFNSLLAAYQRKVFCELSENLLATAHLNVEQRLARWLAIFFQRSGSETLPLTHNTLSKIMGVRRAGITVALHVLEGERAIKATRACIRILDAERLSALAQ